MSKEEYILLVEKVADGTASDAELALYNTLFRAFQNNEESWTQMGLDPNALEMESLERFYHTINAVQTRKIKLWPRIAGIAAAVIGVAIGIYFYTTRHFEGSEATRNLFTNKNEIAPGGNRATLTIGNAKPMQLSEAKSGVIVGNEITYDDGTAIGSGLNSEGAIPNVTATTPNGGMYLVVLPDRSKVWLNAASKLIFPKQFAGNTRKILLEGEAYLEVAKDAKRPFIVESNGQRVTVLGTHFNVSAYSDDVGIRTTLLEGSVRVDRNGEAVTLKPGQQSLLSGNNITIKQVVAEDAIAWKNGYFMFNNESLENVMERIAKWYNVQVIFEEPDLKSETVFGTISRYENVSKVLRMLERADVVRFNIEGNTIKIKKKK